MKAKFRSSVEWENWKDKWRGRDFPYQQMTFPDAEDPWEWIGINEYPWRTEAICAIYLIYPNSELKEIWKHYGVSVRDDRYLEAALEDIYDLKYNQKLDTIDKYVAWSKDRMENPEPVTYEDLVVKAKRLSGIELPIPKPK